jgi:hypothetical protein
MFGTVHAVATETELVGHVTQSDTPKWAPLLRVVGEELVGSFMWMFGIRTSSGVELHAYKHIDTRQYLHLDLEGNAYIYVPEDRYRRIPLVDALESALEPWWQRLGATRDEERAARAAIEAARKSPDEHKLSLPEPE